MFELQLLLLLYASDPRMYGDATATYARICLADRGKAIMVCATQEHTGKTSVSMAMIAGLARR